MYELKSKIGTRLLVLIVVLLKSKIDTRFLNVIDVPLYELKSKIDTHSPSMKFVLFYGRKIVIEVLLYEMRPRMILVQ